MNTKLFLILIYFFGISGRIFATQEYKYELAICTVFRDDAPYLEEWIEFHRLLGVEHFFLYNHLSKDDFAKVLKSYIAEGVVDLIDWPYDFPDDNHEAWIRIQTMAFNDAIEKNRETCRWIAFIDTDEFLFPCKDDHLVHFLKDYEEFGGLCIAWQLFGTSHVSKILPGELMIEKLVLAGDLNYHSFHKSIVQPHCVHYFGQVHSPVYISPYFHVNGRKERIEANVMFSQDSQDSRDIIRINHYWTRDENYFYNIKLLCRQRRGWSFVNDIEKAEVLNRHFEYSIFRFIPGLKERMEKRCSKESIPYDFISRV